jgi:epoxyqueuosine reductase QueG
MDSAQVELWGVADLSDLVTPEDGSGQGFPRAISFAIPMDPEIMAGIITGPNERYAHEYADVNARINDLAGRLATELEGRGWRAMPLAASDRTDTQNIKGDFPHKTAATRAGIGWVGRNCQLVTFNFGPWLRLGTVFTDMDLPCGPLIEQDYCGKCNGCVEACPAGALSGTLWRPGIPREELLDVVGCDNWKKKHYFEFHRGHNCGICAAACPFGKKSLRRRQRTGGTPDR